MNEQMMVKTIDSVIAGFDEYKQTPLRELAKESVILLADTLDPDNHSIKDIVKQQLDYFSNMFAKEYKIWEQQEEMPVWLLSCRMYKAFYIYFNGYGQRNIFATYQVLQLLDLDRKMLEIYFPQLRWGKDYRPVDQEVYMGATRVFPVIHNRMGSAEDALAVAVKCGIAGKVKPITESKKMDLF